MRVFGKCELWMRVFSKCELGKGEYLENANIGSFSGAKRRWASKFLAATERNTVYRKREI